MLKYFAAAALATVVAGAAFAAAPLPAPSGYINDFAQVMSEGARQNLEAELQDFAASTTNEIAVVTVNSMEGDYIEHYAEQLFQLWGIGDESNDNGVLLLLAIEERDLRIEVGYGLEGALPDSVAASIIADMTPLLQNGDYDGAITLGTRAIMAATQGEYSASQTASDFDAGAALTFIFFGFTVLAWLVAVLARTRSVWAGGVVGAAVGAGVSSIFGWWLFAGLLATFGFVALGLLFDWAVSSAYTEAKKGGHTPPWWTGGAGGFGGGSGGFGGFGGGSSGGGGASGGW